MNSLETLRAIPSDTSLRARSQSIDIAKGIGILSVVVGHVLVGMLSSGLIEASSSLTAVVRWIYFWHMPLFVFLSGYFAHRLQRKSPQAFLRQSLVTLVIPYSFWGMFQAFVYRQTVAAGPANNFQSDLWDLFYSPPLQLWFIYFLVVTQCIYFGSFKLSGSTWVFCAVTLLTIIVLDNCNLPPRSTAMPNRFRENLPWFMIGVIASWNILDGFVSKDLQPKEFSRHANLQLSHRWIALFASGLTSIALLYLPIYEIPEWIRFFIVPIPGLLLIYLAIPLFQATSIGRLLGLLGICSLPIYFGHVLGYAGTRICLQKGLGISSPALHILAGTVGGLGFPLTLLALGNRYMHGMPFRFPWPAFQGRPQPRSSHAD